MGYNDNKMVIYKNSMNAVAFPKLNAKEYDVLYSLLYKVHNQGSNIINITFGELAQLANWEDDFRNSKFARTVISMNKKLLEANFTLALDDEAQVISQQPLFYEFKTDKLNHTVKVQVNPTFVELFNELKQNYTNLELAAVTSFSSKYSKRLYAQLRQYRRTGWWQVEVEELKILLDVPKSYAYGNLVKDAIKPAIKEIEPYLGGILTFEPIYEVRDHTRGRKPVKALRFDFEAEKKPEEIEKPKREEYTCPVCGEKLHLIEGKKGDFWGHDKKTKCRKTYQSIAEIKGYKEMPTREDFENEKPHEYTEKELSWIQKMFDKILNQ